MTFRIILMMVALWTCPMSAQDLYINFESFNSGDNINTEAAMAQMSKTNGNAVTFLMHSTSGPHKIVTANNVGMLTPVTVAGVSYTNPVTTKEWEITWDDALATNYLAWRFAASRKVSVGYELTLTNWSAGIGNYYNPQALDGGTPFSYLSIIDNNPIEFHCETNSGNGGTVNVIQNMKFWVTQLWDSANGKTMYYFYNRTNMTLIGVSSGATANNATINEFRLGMCEDHSITTGTKARIGQVILYTNGTVFPVWPGNNLQVPTNSTRTAVVAAVAAASAGDSLIIPATNMAWGTAVTLDKAGLKVSGVWPSGGSNNTWITNTSGSTSVPAFLVDADMITASNMSIVGMFTNNVITGLGFETDANATPYHFLASHIFFTNLQVAIFWNSYGAAQRCISINNEYMGRHFGYVSGGATVRSEQYPIPFTATNYVFWEDGGSEVNASMPSSSSSLAVCSSQEAASYIVRRYNIKVALKNWAPGFDFHGNDPGIPSLRGDCGGMIYKVAWAFSGAATGNGKFADVRGGQVLVYSNTITGGSFDDEITLREEDSDVPPTDRVENTYVFENYDGTTGTTPMTALVASGDELLIVLNTHFFLTAPGGAYSTWSPPAFWGDGAAQSDPPVSATTITGQGRPVTRRGF